MHVKFALFLLEEVNLYRWQFRMALNTILQEAFIVGKCQLQTPEDQNI